MSTNWVVNWLNGHISKRSLEMAVGHNREESLEGYFRVGVGAIVINLCINVLGQVAKFAEDTNIGNVVNI